MSEVERTGYERRQGLEYPSEAERAARNRQSVKQEVDVSSIESIGAARVRLDFNPSKDDMVDRIKRKTAELIDLCESIRNDGNYGEVVRLTALAQTHYEDAAMWAVKAATARK